MVFILFNEQGLFKKIFKNLILLIGGGRSYSHFFGMTNIHNTIEDHSPTGNQYRKVFEWRNCYDFHQNAFL